MELVLCTVLLYAGRSTAWLDAYISMGTWTLSWCDILVRVPQTVCTYLVWGKKCRGLISGRCRQL